LGHQAKPGLQVLPGRQGHPDFPDQLDLPALKDRQGKLDLLVLKECQESLEHQVLKEGKVIPGSPVQQAPMGNQVQLALRAKQVLLVSLGSKEFKGLQAHRASRGRLAPKVKQDRLV